MTDKARRQIATDLLAQLCARRVSLATVREIAARTGLDRRDVAKVLGRLKSRGLVERMSTGVYRATAGGRAAHAAGEQVRPGPRGPLTGRRRPRDGTLRARVWQGLRRLRKATVRDLVQLAGMGGERDAIGNARAYANTLVAAGYAVALARREPGSAPTSPGFKRYLLIRDTGPKAPVYRPSRREVFDRNTGETYALAPDDLASPAKAGFAKAGAAA